MAWGAAWCARVWKQDGRWHWDVRSPGLRSTGERASWREAYDAALAELAELADLHEGCGGD
jgi:hypothetical protein